MTAPTSALVGKRVIVALAGERMLSAAEARTAYISVTEMSEKRT